MKKELIIQLELQKLLKHLESICEFADRWSHESSSELDAIYTKIDLLLEKIEDQNNK